ncbi:hypothetical protein FRC14_001850 [Serendipita sp. 396]|nr:hypothetical protein FRC14_001850 [Serendipita sp. 396]KAG8803848.1 hypothetical protein FRC16_002705 [Serendipita sp. 398]KAG9057232.1 hypothetical protein FS842_008157 [Serendipita sp. 407]
MLLSPGSATQNLKSNSSIWSKFKKKTNEWDGGGQSQQPAPMMGMMGGGMMGGGMMGGGTMGMGGGMMGGAVMRQRFLTLVHGDMETIKLMPNTYAEAEAMAREWVRPPPEASFHLRVPVEYASLQASRLIHGPWLWISSEETYQIASQGVHGLRIEIVTDAPPPPPEEEPPPPPPPVLEMPATFNLELNPGQIVALETSCSSDDLDMSRTDEGTLVAGMFWGKLEIIHDGDTHQMEFTGTRKDESLPGEFFFDQRVMTKLSVAAKPTTARCMIYMSSPEVQYADIILSLHAVWKFGVTYPPPEPMTDHKVKFFVRVHPGGALEDITNQTVVSSLYYEAMPDTAAFNPSSYISPYNGFAMPVGDFIPHLSRVLDSLGLSLQTRTHFIATNIQAFTNHRNIAYRFMSPSRLTAAIDISVSMESCAFIRLFLLFKGVSDEEMEEFAGSGEKEAASFDWGDTVGFTEAIRDPQHNRVIETSIMDCT